MAWCWDSARPGCDLCRATSRQFHRRQRPSRARKFRGPLHRRAANEWPRGGCSASAQHLLVVKVSVRRRQPAPRSRPAILARANPPSSRACVSGTSSCGGGQTRAGRDPAAERRVNCRPFRCPRPLLLVNRRIIHRHTCHRFLGHFRAVFSSAQVSPTIGFLNRLGCPSLNYFRSPAAAPGFRSTWSILWL